MQMYLYELLLVVTAALWGLSFPAAKYIGNDVDSLSFLAIRLTIAAALLLLIFRKSLKKVTSKMAWLSVGAGALLGFHSFIQLEGLRYTSSGSSAFITSTNIVFVPLFSLLFFKKKPDKGFFSEMLAVTVCFLLSKAQAKLSAAKVSVICSLESVFAMLFAAVIPGRSGEIEPITLSAAVGGIFILLGVIKISVKRNPADKRKTERR